MVGERTVVRLRTGPVEAVPVETMEAFVLRVLPQAYRLAAIMLRDPVKPDSPARSEAKCGAASAKP